MEENNDDEFQKLVEKIRRTIPYPLTDAQAHEATRNLVGFFETLIEIHKQMRQNKKHDEDCGHTERPGDEGCNS